MIGRFAVVCMVLLTAGVKAQGPAKKFEMSKEEHTLLELINEERKKNKVAALKPSPLLFKVARTHSANMAEQQKMAHELDGKTPIDRLKEARYAYVFAGENIASIYRDLEKVVKAWMESELHRNNILNERFTETGLGIVRDKAGDPYYTQVFGKPR